jgi:thiamine phosphate synthase YjbQ (UPF0047 family)
MADMSFEAREKVLKFVIYNVGIRKVNVHGHGSSVNLDELDDALCADIYELVDRLCTADATDDDDATDDGR